MWLTTEVCAHPTSSISRGLLRAVSLRQEWMDTGYHMACPAGVVHSLAHTLEVLDPFSHTRKLWAVKQRWCLAIVGYDFRDGEELLLCSALGWQEWALLESPWKSRRESGLSEAVGVWGGFPYIHTWGPMFFLLLPYHLLNASCPRDKEPMGQCFHYGCYICLQLGRSWCFLPWDHHRILQNMLP